ncbi:MAG: pyridoxamine 5'-phosphate oxidase family protein [Litorimonas sp.]
MADLTQFETEPRIQMLEELRSARCLMLGSPDADQHMQPMAPQIDCDTIRQARNHGEAVIHFFSSRASDLGRAVMDAPGATVDAAHIDSDYQVSMRGRLFPVEHDGVLIGRFWNPVAASWFPGGQQDPDLLMLRFDLSEAAIWASTGNPLTFLYETAKANLTGSRPDLGKSRVIAA